MKGWLLRIGALGCCAGVAWGHALAQGELGPGEPLGLKWSYQLGSPQAAPPMASTVDVPHAFSIDASSDSTSRYGSSQDVSLTWAPGGRIHESGWRFRVAYNRSRYAYPLNDPERTVVHGRSRQLDWLIGYGLHRPSWALTTLLGSARAKGNEGGQAVPPQEGFKASVSLFAAPSERSRTFASLQYTARSDYTQALWKWGWLLGGSGSFAGPEIKADWRGRDFWDSAPQVSRWGVHLSGVDWQGLSWGVSMGRISGDAFGTGNYLGFGFYGSL